MFDFIVKALGGVTKEEAINANKIARDARMAELVAKEENKRLRLELHEARELEAPGYSIQIMEDFIKQSKIKDREYEERIGALEKALKIQTKKNEDMKKILKMSSIKGGVR